MSKRDQVRMSPAEVAAYLTTQRTLNVATVGSDDAIHLVAMWFVVEDGCPLFWTYGSSQKIVNLRRDPRLTALVESGDTYGELRGVELVGRGEVISDRAEVLRVGAALQAKYAGTGSSADLERAGAKRVVVRMTVERTVSWDHSKLGPATY